MIKLREILQLKEIKILLILAISSRLIFQSFLPKQPTQLAPDEATYASLTKWVENEKDVIDFPTFGANLYNSSRSFIWPSALLHRLGLNEYQSIRLVSAAYGILSILIFLLLIANLTKFHQSQSNKITRRLSLVSIWVFAFLPSHFLWSILGLRETASEFWLISSFYFIYILVTHKNELVNLLFFMILLSLSLAFSFGARKETAYIFVLSFFSYFIIKSHKFRTFTISFSIAFGALLGLIFTSSNNSSPEISFKSVLEEPVISRLTSIDDQRNLNTIGAESALAKSKCGAYEIVDTEYYECQTKALPYNLGSFLFRPLPILDSGSLKLTIAGLENVFWIFLVSSFIYSLRSLFKSKAFTQTSIPLVLFTLMFSIASAIYEGNMGTAFRHKSSILWAMLLLICSLRVHSVLNSQKSNVIKRSDFWRKRNET